jgi:hypothetical protein
MIWYMKSSSRQAIFDMRCIAMALFEESKVDSVDCRSQASLDR